jgi:hypothetical protein
MIIFFTFLFSSDQYWNFYTIYGGLELSRNRVVVPARQASQPSGISSLESILGLLKSLKIRAQVPAEEIVSAGARARHLYIQL